jgi:hypothetical protein
MKTVEGYEVDRKALALLEDGESPAFAARPSYVTVDGGANWDATTLLLTNRRLVVTKDRLFGKGKADVSIDWAAVSSVRGELWQGGGPKIQLLVENAQTRAPIEMIVPPEYAADVESAIRSGYLPFRS